MTRNPAEPMAGPERGAQEVRHNGLVGFAGSGPPDLLPDVPPGVPPDAGADVPPGAPPDAGALVPPASDAAPDPYVYLRPLRDASGRIVDFVVTHPNRMACQYLQMPREALDGSRIMALLPGVTGSSLLAACVDAVQSDAPLALDDVPHEVRPLGEERHCDLRAVRVGDGLAFTWRDVTERSRAGRELARSEQRFRTALEISAAGIATTDLERRLLQVNAALCQLVGRDADWLLGRSIEAVLHPEDDEKDRAMRARLIAGEVQSAAHEQRLLHAGGRVLWVQHAIALVRDEQGRPESFVSQFFDVTDSHRNSVLIEAATEAIIDPFAIWAVSSDGPQGTRLLRANPAMRGILLGTRRSLERHTLAEIFPAPLDSIARTYQRELATAVRGNRPFVARDQTWLNTMDGAESRVWRPTLSPIGEGLVAVLLRDVTEEVRESRRLERELEEATEAARRDPLTNLLNRRALMTVLATILSHPPRAGTHLAILFCDIDGLKSVNDSLGHLAGDRLIVEVSRRIQRAVRVDDSVARLGGDEFVVVLTALNRPEDAEDVAHNVCAAVAEPLHIDGRSVRITLSVGVASASVSNEPATLLDLADQALYRAKQSGRARVAVSRPAESWEI